MEGSGFIPARKGAVIPTEREAAAVLADIDHDAVYEEVLETLETATKVIGKNVCDELYGALLDTVQDYLKDNVRFNIASTLATAERGRRAEWDRAEAAEKRAGLFEDFTRRLGRLITSDEWVGSGRSPVPPQQAVEAIDREIRNARAVIAKATPAPSASQPGTQPGLPGEVNQSPANQEQGHEA